MPLSHPLTHPKLNVIVGFNDTLTSLARPKVNGIVGFNDTLTSLACPKVNGIVGFNDTLTPPCSPQSHQRQWVGYQPTSLPLLIYLYMYHPHC